ncbi:hypothetical protein [Amycolatopsis jejuensis]|uniref:hypothetical protein n=1 Tax=Amycolatopsis jejuensis TaxID=330084 RepID=UPI0005253507|nr:hypothetical protein [Amycolatopsis jejuensis]
MHPAVVPARARALLLPVFAVLLAASAAAGIGLGLWIHRQGTAAMERAPGRSVVAVVHPEPGALFGTEGAAVPRTRHITWTAPDGGTEEADVPLRSDPSTPGLTRIRVDGRGHLLPASPDRADVVSMALIAAGAWEVVTLIGGYALYRRFARPSRTALRAA